MSVATKTVCVTGASGYIASWLVKFLLQRGYTVKASVRDTNDPKRTQHLLALGGAKERLHLIKANLMEEGSFDAVVDGCDGVFHTASPFYHATSDTQAELIDPALKGTLNVLGSCAKSPSIKRVVLTSSIAAVAYNGKPRTPEVVVDETWWSNPEVLKQMQQWYVLSKTLAEDAAWKFVKDRGIDLVTINPAMVIGPLLQPTLNTSAAAILSLINDDPKRTQHLLALDGAKERLHLIKANLMEEGSFDAVVDGCDGVFHTASPSYYATADPQAELIDPALKGTLNVLGSCAKSPSIKRVVLTSSIAAVAYNGKPRTPEVIVDETWWSNPEVLKQMQVSVLRFLFE
ncbi:hypothetical protein BUALT_Bualt02G0182900 [Buddleja alternifolia]|uniref:Dihydroflavonol 4-reductase n=1 Tax=Buddleja alternifolia TaxID=168488 RepID=A0AAV6YC05_9LAMI|nr:hypothetical protein BUALT_Bualt02G0182900 [Buddleja alternifolia]